MITKLELAERAIKELERLQTIGACMKDLSLPEQLRAIAALFDALDSGIPVAELFQWEEPDGEPGMQIALREAADFIERILQR